MAKDDYVYLDIETTGLVPEIHQIVEVAWALNDDDINRFVPEHTLKNASAKALSINRYHGRGLGEEKQVSWSGSTPARLASELRDSTIVGSSPGFDTKHLRRQPRFKSESWNHRLLDLPLWAAGLFGWPVSRGLWDTADYVREELGYTDLPHPDHTARGDVHATRELHRVLMKVAAIRRFGSLPEVLKQTEELLEWRAWKAKQEITASSLRVTSPEDLIGTDAVLANSDEGVTVTFKLDETNQDAIRMLWGGHVDISTAGDEG